MSAPAQTFDPAIGALALDGVQYAFLRGREGVWRMGSVNPAWREELALLWPPDGEAVRAGERDIWLAPDLATPSLAVMCCGLGSAYPGMGRGLYDNFPVARAAMDEIAVIASWDVLKLMDEPDLAVINQTRWQIPYLFMLEYAQWTQLHRLGFTPSLVCGHSLGELVALCVAGVYSLKTAWFLLDAHASLLADLEAKTGNSTAMLAIPAELSVISEHLRDYPSLAIANHNTARQFILAGPREDLAKVRKALRRSRVPAMFLGMGIAFHNPAMRTLRGVCQRRLAALEMRAPRIPLLSCVTAAPYPATPDGIRDHIVNLQERSVIWPDLVGVIRRQYGIRHFLELGPQETLCGLVQENAPQSACMACGRKNGEVAAMRQVCGRLFALGAIRYAAIAAEKKSRPLIGATAEARPAITLPERETSLAGVTQEEMGVILHILSEVSGVAVEGLRPEQDLRHDLALRSSNFPWLVQEAEKRLQREIPMENLFQISTVGDLVLFLSGHHEASCEGRPARGLSMSSFTIQPPFLRFALPEHSGRDKPQLLPINVCERGVAINKGDLIVLLLADDASPDLALSLAPFGCFFAVPRQILDKCDILRKAGAGLLPLSCANWPSATELAAALAGNEPDGFLFIPPLRDAAGAMEPFSWLYDEAGRLAEQWGNSWICILQRFGGELPQSISMPEMDSMPGVRAYFSDGLRLGKASGAAVRLVAWLEADPHAAPFAADMLGQELFCSKRAAVIWRQWIAPDGEWPSFYCPAADCLYPVFPDEHPPLPPGNGIFQGLFQNSRFFDSSFDSHGVEASYRPLAENSFFRGEPWLPISAALDTIVAATRFPHPWLPVNGFMDLRFASFPALPRGITREGRIACRSLPWMPQDGAMTRVVRVNLTIRSIAENGRRGGDWLPYLEASCLLAGQAGGMPPIWENAERMGADLPDTAAIFGRIFYDTLGMSEPWRILREFRFGKKGDDGADPVWGVPLLEAVMTIPESFIENGTDWNYKDFLYLIDGAFHGCLAALALSGGREPATVAAVAESLSSWRFCGIGFIRFDRRIRPALEECRLFLWQSWLDGKTTRFDAQVCGADGRLLLTLHNMEFLRAGEALSLGAGHDNGVHESSAAISGMDSGSV